VNALGALHTLIVTFHLSCY